MLLEKQLDSPLVILGVSERLPQYFLPWIPELSIFIHHASFTNINTNLFYLI